MVIALMTAIRWVNWIALCLAVAMAMDEGLTKVAQAKGPIRLQSGPVWVGLSDAGPGLPFTHAMLQAALGKGRTVLVLSGISAEAAPGTRFAVYLGVPEGATPMPDDPRLVGRFSLFDEVNQGALRATPSSRSFDITTSLERQLAPDTINQPLGVTIVPERALAPTAQPTIGSISIVRP